MDKIADLQIGKKLIHIILLDNFLTILVIMVIWSNYDNNISRQVPQVFTRLWNDFCLDIYLQFKFNYPTTLKKKKIDATIFYKCMFKNKIHEQ